MNSVSISSNSVSVSGNAVRSSVRIEKATATAVSATDGSAAGGRRKMSKLATAVFEFLLPSVGLKAGNQDLSHELKDRDA